MRTDSAVASLTTIVGAKALSGFDYHNHDLRVTRVFRLTEQSRIEFLTKFFNILNHTNLLFGRNDDGFFRTHFIPRLHRDDST